MFSIKFLILSIIAGRIFDYTEKSKILGLVMGIY